MFLFFCFFKQKTAYEMRISDWSSDVCSSDLPSRRGFDKLSPSSGRTEIKKGNYMKLDSTVSTVVTGGASGLGAATARALAAKGVKVATFDLQEEKGLASASDLGGLFCECNVTTHDSVDTASSKASKANGPKRIPSHT